ncbi:MAG: PTS sugar transporter subunit IIA [Planctomycetota bacterium]
MVDSLSELLPASRIVKLECRSKNEALQSLLDVLASSGAIPQRIEAERAILSREVLMSTGIGYGIAVPHAKLPDVPEFAVALAYSNDGIEYSSVVDDQPVKLICMIIGCSGQQDRYLKILAMIMRFLKSEKGKILSAYSQTEIHGFTRDYDTSERGPIRNEGQSVSEN